MANRFSFVGTRAAPTRIRMTVDARCAFRLMYDTE